MPNTTRRCAFAAIALLLLVGCTTEESSSGCSLTTVGFSNSSQSELGVGSFEYKAKDGASSAPYAKPIPVAVGKGASFELSFKPYDDKNSKALDYALRSANSELLEQSPADATGGTFNTKKAGIVAVLATSRTDPKQVFDLVHLRVLAPTKIKLSGLLTESDNRALDKGMISVPAGSSASITVGVLGEVDEANGPIPDATWKKGHAVGELIELEGVVLSVESSDEKIVTVEAQGGGEVLAKTIAPGTAQVKVKAGDLTKSVEVVVTKSGRGPQ